MNATEPVTDELIQAVFDRRADRAAGYDLGRLERAIATTTAEARQRSRWSVRLAGARPIIAPRPAWVAIAILAALVGLGIALVLIGQRPSTPFHTGLLAYIRDGDLYLANPDGSNAEVVLHQDGSAFLTVAWSPDASRLAVDGESGVVLVDAATGAATRIGGTNPVWSPDGRQLAVLDQDDGSLPAVGTRVRIMDIATGATVHTYPFPAIGDMAWSPNGRWIAATGGSGGRLNALARLDVTTGRWIDIDGPSGMLDSTRQPAWSPDSLHIAYVRWDVEGAALCNGRLLCQTDVYVADADGSNPVRLNRVPAKADRPAWSPDGLWIAYRSVDHRAVNVGNGGSILDTGTAIVIVHPDGAGERTIAADGVADFAWGADSDRLRFVSTVEPGSGPTLWDAPLDGRPRQIEVTLGTPPDLFERTGTWHGWQTLADGRAAKGLPSVASPAPTSIMSAVAPPSAQPADPSGTWPEVASTSDDGCQPALVSTTTGARTPIANLCDDTNSVDTWSWSPTGSAFAAVRGGALVIVGRDGHVTFDVAHLTGLTSIDWSPDGSWLGVSTGARAWLLRPDGSGLREIPGEALWSDDGRTLRVAAYDGRLLIGGPDGSDLHATGSLPLGTSSSPDGSRFAFVRDGNAWTADLDGSDARSVTSMPLGGATSVSFSPDGRWIAVWATHGFWLVRPDGTGQTWFGVGVGQTLNQVRWAPDARRLAVETYTSAPGDQKQGVYLVDPDGSPTVRLDDFTMPSWSPDGRFLAGERDETDPTARRSCS